MQEGTDDLRPEQSAQSRQDIFTDEDRALGAHEKKLLKASSEGRAEDERWHQSKDGYCSGVVTPFQRGDVKGFIKIARDITVRSASKSTTPQSTLGPPTR